MRKIYRVHFPKSIGLKIRNLSGWNCRIYRVGIGTIGMGEE